MWSTYVPLCFFFLRQTCHYVYKHTYYFVARRQPARPGVYTPGQRSLLSQVLYSCDRHLRTQRKVSEERRGGAGGYQQERSKLLTDQRSGAGTARRWMDGCQAGSNGGRRVNRASIERMRCRVDLLRPCRACVRYGVAGERGWTDDGGVGRCRWIRVARLRLASFSSVGREGRGRA